MVRPVTGSGIIQATRFVPLVALRGLISRDGLGVYASSDTMFKGAVFGRDSLEVCEDLLQSRRLLVRQSLLALASLQGEIDDPRNEEEPGKIVHEYRSNLVDGKPIVGKQLEIFNDLYMKWGGSDDILVYYGSVDATPQFVRVVGRFCKRYGPRLLDTPVYLRSGHQLRMSIIVENCLTWLLRQLEASRSGLLEYQRRNPHGILNQVWKDSDEFYVHPDGTMANHAAPIASVEVQGLAYDALMTGAYLLPNRASQYREAATKLREQTIELLWQPAENYFALGTDIDPATNELRVITTMTANPAALLDSYFFDDLPPPARERYIGGIVRHIVSDEFLTDAGIRSRSLSQAHLVPFWDYHGSYVSWPKETYDIAKGLARQGFRSLARELENRLINVCLKNRAYPEFVYVDATGRVLAAKPSHATHGGVTLVISHNQPERIQAWTVSAVLAIINDRLKHKLRRAPAGESTRWPLPLEQTLLAAMPRVNRLFNPVRLNQRYPTNPYQLKDQ